VVDNPSQFGKVEKLKINGEIVALLGSQREEKTVEIDVKEKQETKVGPFSIQVGKPGAGGLMGVFSMALSGTPPAKKESDNVGVKLAGPMSAVIDAKFKADDQDLRPCYSFDEKARDYTFQKPKSGKLILTLSYWNDLKEAKVKIGE
jgi:hypothetical protein